MSSDNEIAQMKNPKLETLCSLAILDLSNNSLQLFSLANHPSLIELDLSKNSLMSFDAEDLPCLFYLNLSINTLQHLKLTGLSSLADLNLSANNLTEFVNVSLPDLTNLDFSNNQLENFSLNNLSSLVSLNLSRNSFASFSFDVLKSSNESLEVVDLSFNRLSKFVILSNDFANASFVLRYLNLREMFTKDVTFIPFKTLFLYSLNSKQFNFYKRILIRFADKLQYFIK
jgi:hypothetical protein